MQDKELFKEFLAFCENQPSDKKIDHKYWSTCAVGEFLTNRGVEMDRSSNTYNTPEITQLIGDQGNDLWQRLDCRSAPNNYGTFAVFLKQYL